MKKLKLLPMTISGRLHEQSKNIQCKVHNNEKQVMLIDAFKVASSCTKPPPISLQFHNQGIPKIFILCQFQIILSKLNRAQPKALLSRPIGKGDLGD
jgi:hypothetical protein